MKIKLKKKKAMPVQVIKKISKRKKLEKKTKTQWTEEEKILARDILDKKKQIDNDYKKAIKELEAKNRAEKMKNLQAIRDRIAKI